MSEREEYLGDGLYASFDGWQIRLRAPRENGDHVVFLEDGTLAAFLEYLKTLPITREASHDAQTATEAKRRDGGDPDEMGADRLRRPSAGFHQVG
jgi:hypothetical protein